MWWRRHDGEGRVEDHFEKEGSGSSGRSGSSLEVSVLIFCLRKWQRFEWFSFFSWLLIFLLSVFSSIISNSFSSSLVHVQMLVFSSSFSTFLILCIRFFMILLFICLSTFFFFMISFLAVFHPRLRCGKGTRSSAKSYTEMLSRVSNVVMETTRGSDCKRRHFLFNKLWAT